MPISKNTEATIEVRFKDIDPELIRMSAFVWCSIRMTGFGYAQALSKTTRLKIENSMCLIQKVKK